MGGEDVEVRMEDERVAESVNQATTVSSTATGAPSPCHCVRLIYGLRICQSVTHPRFFAT